ncbi:MAG: alpha/beta hydrolase-fold protein [Phycisphaerae bacterium]
MEVRFPARLRAEPANGRLLLLMIDAAQGDRSPLGAPFWMDPQPIYSTAVHNVTPGAAMRLDARAAAFPVPLNALTGQYRIQAVLDVDETFSRFGDSADNLISDIQTVTFDPGQPVQLELQLDRHVEPPQVADTPRVKQVILRSQRLSAFWKRDVFLRAGVVLPEGFDQAPARRYATIYHIPGFGGRHFSAWRRRGSEHALDRQVVHVYLDPDGPFGHHLFVNSQNNGPVGDALVHELIPHLQRRFRLIDQTQARLLTGHSSGGFTSVWLQINYPRFFGGCWATSPDPVDFRAFQNVNLYQDRNAFVQNDGQERPSIVVQGKTVCSMGQEYGMEQAMDPTGASGQQWASWMAAFSPRGPDGRPVPLWDTNGSIDAEVAEFWRRRDPALILQRRWPDLGPIMAQRLRIIVGSQDNFSLHVAVGLLDDVLSDLPGWPGNHTPNEGSDRGYIEVIPGRNHFNLYRDGLADRIRREMLTHLRRTHHTSGE